MNSKDKRQSYISILEITLQILIFSKVSLRDSSKVQLSKQRKKCFLSSALLPCHSCYQEKKTCIIAQNWASRTPWVLALPSSSSRGSFGAPLEDIVMFQCPSDFKAQGTSSDQINSLNFVFQNHISKLFRSSSYCMKTSADKTQLSVEGMSNAFH